MKNLRQKVAGVLLLLSALIYAQTTNSPWVISVGGHAINNKIDADGTHGEAFSYSHYKFVPPPTKLGVARSLNKYFVADVQLSLGSIPNETVGLKETFFMSLVPGIQYKLNSLWGNEDFYFDPYLRLGSGLLIHDYSSIGGYGRVLEKSHFIATLGLGSNFWFTDKVGASFQLDYVPTPGDKSAIVDYFQASVSVSFRFGKSDSDGDGVPDHLDRCPTVPGPPESQGCPDLDKDGVPDIDDMCPTVFGPVENAGCPWPDTDGDGVPDHIDKCPTVFGPAENAGCPWPDTDGDGIPDHLDRCPTVPGTEEYDGCPTPPAKQQTHYSEPTYDTSTDNKLTDLFSSILFDTDSAVIKARSMSSLDAIANMLKDSREDNFLITGHTDTVGNEIYNIQLAKKRIESVVKALAMRGVNIERLRYKIVGSKEAIYTPNAPHKLRLSDRKVVIRRIVSGYEWNTYDRIIFDIKFLDNSVHNKRIRR